jgi:hypothetical protein
MGRYNVEIVKGKITYLNTWPVHDEEAPIPEKQRTHIVFRILVDGLDVEVMKPISEEFSSFCDGEEVIMEKRSTNEITEDIRNIFPTFYMRDSDADKKYINYDLQGKSKVKTLTR